MIEIDIEDIVLSLGALIVIIVIFCAFYSLLT